MNLFAVDKGGQMSLVESLQMVAQHEDSTNSSYGPNGAVRSLSLPLRPWFRKG